MAKLKIVGNGELKEGIQISLDGNPVQGLAGLDLIMRFDEPNRLNLEFFLEDVDIELNTLANMDSITGCQHPTEERDDLRTMGNKLTEHWRCRLCGYVEEVI